MIAALLLVASVHAGEYRRLELADGRVVTVEVLGTEPVGLVVATPQGRMHLPYEQVLSITPADAEAYASGGAARILVLPFTAAGAALPEDASRAQGIVWHELNAIPATELATLAQAGANAPPGTSEALAACGADLGCVRSLGAGYAVDVIVGGTLGGGQKEALSLVIAYPRWPQAGGTATATLAGSADAQHLAAQAAAHVLLGLEPPVAAAVATGVVPVPDPVPEPVPEPQPTPPGRRPVAPWVAAIPLPGVTAFAGGDVGHGLAAIALTVPATAGVGFVAGANASRPEELIGLTVAGWWAMCAVTNLAWMPTVTPTEGGARVTVSGAF